MENKMESMMNDEKREVVIKAINRCNTLAEMMIETPNLFESIVESAKQMTFEYGDLKATECDYFWSDFKANIGCPCAYWFGDEGYDDEDFTYTLEEAKEALELSWMEREVKAAVDAYILNETIGYLQSKGYKVEYE